MFYKFVLLIWMRPDLQAPTLGSSIHPLHCIGHDLFVGTPACFYSAATTRNGPAPALPARPASTAALPALFPRFIFAPPPANWRCLSHKALEGVTGPRSISAN